MQQMVCDILYYVYVLFFGAYSAIRLACGRFGQEQKRLFFVLCPGLLIVQGLLLDLLDIEWIWRLYPLVAHLPIVLALLLFLHAKWSTALLSVIVSYSLCQMMRWIGLVVSVFCQTPVTVLMIHLALCTMLLFLLDRYCMRSIHALLCQAGKLPYVFGALPLLYYIYEYFMLYTQRRYAEIQAFQELLPTAMLLFFVLFGSRSQRRAHYFPRRSPRKKSSPISASSPVCIPPPTEAGSACRARTSASLR